MQESRLLKEVIELRAFHEAGLEKADRIIKMLSQKATKTKVSPAVIAKAIASRKAKLLKK